MKALQISQTCCSSVLAFGVLLAAPTFAADIVVTSHVADRIVAGSQSSSIPSLTKPDDALVLAAAYEAFRWNPRLTREEFTQQVLDAKREFYLEWTPSSPDQPPGV